MSEPNDAASAKDEIALGDAAGAILHNPLPEGQPFYAKIGRVAAEWAHLEHTLDTIIWDLSGIDPVKGACITAQVTGARGRYNVLTALGKLKGLKGDTIKRINVLMNDTFGIQEQRNRIVHDAWFIDTNRNQITQHRSMPVKNPAFGFEDVSDQGIDLLISKIHLMVEDAIALRTLISDELEPSPEICP